ncbi:4'-phosphopantetheinyl transferase superfamily protein [Streptococcus sp. KHUD_013]|uniref:4'-phosphopantetheinyl transferase superfamily protein n=1 Tax=Streptococcus sp. KHUD_013 TaxID=3413147 RepID=UPI00403FD8DE
MIYGHGIDIQNFERTRVLLEKYDSIMVDLIYTENEWKFIKQCNTDCIFRATLLFSLKESASKALGTGFRGIKYSDIEIKIEKQTYILNIKEGLFKDNYNALLSFTCDRNNIYTSVILEVEYE